MSKKTTPGRPVTKATDNIIVAQEVPIFSETQLRTFNSKYVDGFDEAMAVLDETNKTPVGLTEEEKAHNK